MTAVTKLCELKINRGDHRAYVCAALAEAGYKVSVDKRKDKSAWPRDAYDYLVIVEGGAGAGVHEESREAVAGEYVRVVVPTKQFDGRYDLGDVLLVTQDYRTIIDQWKHRAVGFTNITHPSRNTRHCVIENSDYVVLVGYAEPDCPKGGVT